MRKPKIVGLAGIDKGIKALAGIGNNLNERVQDIAVAIVEHAAGPGNGDMSRALTLVQTVNRMRTLNANYLVGWFRYFGNANVNLRGNDGTGKVSLLSKDSKAYRGGFDVEGARVNNWFDAFNANGERSTWYAGPAQPEFTPFTIGDIASQMQGFVKRTRTLLEKQVDERGYKGPAVKLAEPDQQQLNHALAFIERISNTLARHEEVEQAAKKMAEAQELAKKDEIVVKILQQEVDEQPKEKAVA